MATAIDINMVRSFFDVNEMMKCIGSRLLSVSCKVIYVHGIYI